MSQFAIEGVQPNSALMDALGGHRLLAVDAAGGVVRVEFTAKPEFTHSNGRVVQGGFISGWLDAAMAMATLAYTQARQVTSTLELKVSFLERVGPGKVVAEGRVVRCGKRVIFLEAALYNESGALAATASSSCLLVPYSVA